MPRANCLSFTFNWEPKNPQVEILLRCDVRYVKTSVLAEIVEIRIHKLPAKYAHYCTGSEYRILLLMLLGVLCIFSRLLGNLRTFSSVYFSEPVQRLEM